MNRREEIRRQLMETFQVELKDHLATLNRGLLVLEKSAPAETSDALLGEIFRAAHSLKGAARSVELYDIEAIAHRLEDVLGAFRRRELFPSPALLDRLFPALDALQEAMDAHLRGEGLPDEKREGILASLQAALAGEAPSPAQPVGLPIAVPLPPVSLEAASSVVVQAQASAPSEEALTEPPAVGSLETPASRPLMPGHDETIRVSTAKLDALMASMGELLAARMRSDQRLDELKGLQVRTARWDKSWRKTRLHYKRLLHQGQQVAPSETSIPELPPLLDFLTRNETELKVLNNSLASLMRQLTQDYHRLALLTDDLQDVIRRVRMLPFSTLFEQFPRMVRDLARSLGKEVNFEIQGEDTEVDRQVLETLKDPLIHLLRNAVVHGAEIPEVRRAANKPGPNMVRLQATQKGNIIALTVSDDGAGIDQAAVRRAAVAGKLLGEVEAASLSDQEALQLIFRPGFSTLGRATDLAGRGFGLDIVRENLEQLHGLVDIATTPGKGTVFTLSVPLTLATTHVLLVSAADQLLAVPTTAIERILRIDPLSLGSVEGRPVIRSQSRVLPLVSLAQALGSARMQVKAADGSKIPVIVLGLAEKRMAFQVDSLHGTQEVVVKSLGRQLRRVRNISGGAILGSGRVVMVLNIADLIKTAQGDKGSASVSPFTPQPVVRHKVLVVDDSITTRTLEKNILEKAGYQVNTAANGYEAWALVQSQALDAVVTDVNMPEMDGYVLTEKIKTDNRYKELPVVLVTSLETAQNKLRGLEVGADAYIVKSTFDHQDLLATLERLIG